MTQSTFELRIHKDWLQLSLKKNTTKQHSLAQAMAGSLPQSMHLEKQVWQWIRSTETNSGMLIASGW